MLTLLNRHTRNGEALYEAAFALFTVFMTLAGSMLGQSAFFQALLPPIQCLCLGLVCVKILISGQWSQKNFAPSLGLMVLSIIVCFVADDIRPMLFTFLTFGAYGQSTKRLARLFLYCAGGVLLLSLLCTLFGVVENRMFYRPGSDTPRHSMGMVHTTVWASTVFFLWAVRLYLRKNRTGLWDLLLTAGLTAAVYLCSRTRTVLAAGLLMIPLVFCYRTIRRRKAFRWLVSCSLLLSPGISCLLFYLFQWNPDASYIRFGLQYGIPLNVCFLLLLTWMLLQLSRRGNTWLLTFVFLSAVCGIFISDIFNPALCPFLPLACAAYGNLCPDTQWSWAKQIPQPDNDGEM